MRPGDGEEIKTAPGLVAITYHHDISTGSLTGSTDSFLKFL